MQEGRRGARLERHVAHSHRHNYFILLHFAFRTGKQSASSYFSVWIDGVEKAFFFFALNNSERLIRLCFCAASRVVRYDYVPDSLFFVSVSARVIWG